MSPMKVCADHIEAVNVARDDGTKEEDAIEYGVPSSAGNHHYC